MLLYLVKLGYNHLVKRKFTDKTIKKLTVLLLLWHAVWEVLGPGVGSPPGADRVEVELPVELTRVRGVAHHDLRVVDLLRRWLCAI